MQSIPLPAHVHAVESHPVDETPGLLVRATRRIAAAADVRDYVTMDRRTLGLSRILLGYLLIGDLCHRGRWWLALYSNEGVLPTGAAPRPIVDEFSIFNAFATPSELYVLFALMLATFVCLLVGYRTRVAQVLALVFVSGMNSRVLLAETQGYVCENLLLLWTCILPLGDRFSVDALIASMRRRPEASAGALNDRENPAGDALRAPLRSILGVGILLQLSAVYYLNWVAKTGEAWTSGHALHYMLHLDRMGTPLAALLRDRIPGWLVVVLSHTALFIEAALAFVLLCPFGRVWMRRIAIVMIVSLHAFIGLFLRFGPFSWTLCVFASLLISRADWELAARAMRRPRRARTVIFDAVSGRAVLLCRVIKRLDAFRLLSFEAGEAGPLGITAVTPGASRPDAAPRRASAIVADILAALPLGPIAALPLRTPLLRDAADLGLAALARLPRSPLAPAAPSPVAPSPPPPKATWRVGPCVREIAAVALLAGTVNGVLADNAFLFHGRFAMVEPFRTVTRKLRIFQSWFMMAPNPPVKDSMLVVDAVTVDGRHVDPLSLHAEPYTLRAPDFDLSHRQTLGIQQPWSDYMARISSSWGEQYRPALEQYLLRLPQRTGRAEDTLVSGDVYWITDQSPALNETAPYGYEKKKLFSFDRRIARPR